MNPSSMRGFAFVATLALAACGKQAAAPHGPGGNSGGGPPPATPVSVVQVQLQKVPLMLETVGTLEGAREVEVRPRVAGVLQRQLFREGEPMAAGAVLYQIERAPLELALDAARARQAQEESRLEQARRENGRLATLVADKAISQREADDAGSTLKIAQGSVAAAVVQVREAQLNLSYAQVTAPIGGIVQRSQRSEGSLVSPADSIALTTLVQTNPIRVRFALTEAEAALLRGGKQQVRLLGADGKPLPAVAKLDFAGSVVDARLGTVQMRAELANAGGTLLPGQVVRAQVISGEEQGFLVPQAAVMSGEQGRFVWVIGAEGKAISKPVQVGPWQGADWVIRSGLAAGDRVITDNLMMMRPGAAVQAKAAASAATAASKPTAAN